MTLSAQDQMPSTAKDAPEAPPATTQLDVRCPALLARGAAEVGNAWAQRVRLALHAEQRAASGGWPGRLSEARHYAQFSLLPWLREHGVTEAELPQASVAASHLNSAARQAWAKLREPVPQENSDLAEDV